MNRHPVRGAVKASDTLRLVNGNTGDIIAMYKLFGDESGYSEREKVCVVTGFIGTEAQWDDFSNEWRRVLDEAGVKVFHGLDFWDWHLDPNTKEVIREIPYEGWGDDDDFAFIDSLLKVIEKTRLQKAGTGIDISLFHDLAEDERRWLTTSAVFDGDWGQRGSPNDPYFAAFQSAIVGAARVVPPGEKMYPMFDRRDPPDRSKQPKHTKAREIYNELLDQSALKVRDRLGDTLLFGSPEENLGLQAADLLANRSRVFVADGFGGYPLDNRVREFLESGYGFVEFLGLRGLDLVVRGCPFRTTFWKTEQFKAAEPDYLERMRAQGKVVAYKNTRDSTYYSHHIRPHRLRDVLKLGVSGDLVYIEECEDSTQPDADSEFGKGR
jgi:hypothetical protein